MTQRFYSLTQYPGEWKAQVHMKTCANVYGSITPRANNPDARQLANKTEYIQTAEF